MSKALHGDVRGEQGVTQGDDLPSATDELDILNVGYVLARPGERVANRLVPVHRWRLPDSTVIVAYRNPSHWGDAVGRLAADQAPELVRAAPELRNSRPALRRPVSRRPAAAARGPSGAAMERHDS
jgi:hypothetical protein